MSLKYISQLPDTLRDEGRLGLKYTFSGSVLFDRMEKLNLYATDAKEIEERVGEVGMTAIFAG